MNRCSDACWPSHNNSPAKTVKSTTASQPAHASKNGSTDGFRVIINTGRIGGQEVPHLHAHIVGGPEPVGPMFTRN